MSLDLALQALQALHTHVFEWNIGVTGALQGRYKPAFQGIASIMDDMKLYGVPGGGKTTQGQKWLEDCVAAGFDIYRAAFVSFTNAAVDEARERLVQQFGVDAEEMPYCRTLHSLCKRSLGITERDWCADNHLKEFGEAHGYDLVPTRCRMDEDGIEEVMTSGGADAALLNVWDFARHRLIEQAEAGFRAFQEYDPDATARMSYVWFRQFVLDYEAWKQASGLLDYTDLLLRTVADPLPLAVSVAVIDEAQDLSPLMWRAADALFADAEARGTLGDDDQTLYSFSGAAPELMNQRPARQVVKLEQSYRLPRRVVAAAEWIIRQNRDREPKVMTARDAEGEVSRETRLEDLPLTNGESWFLLARNWRLLDQFTAPLEDAGIPYRVLGGRYSPWDEKGPLRAARTMLKLADGGAVSLADLQALADRTPSGNSKRPGVWEYGAKRKLADRAAAEPGAAVTWREILELGMMVEAFKRLLRRDLSMLKVSVRDLTAYENAARAGRFDAETRITLGSVHSVKGKQAENVCLLLGCTGAPARAMLRPERAEEERRVAYVGATRARQRLYGLLPRPGAGVFAWEVAGI